MSIFDALNSYEGQQALGLLAAAGGRSDGAGFGQRMLEGLGQGEKWKQQQAAQALQKLQMDNYLSEIEQRKAAQAQAEMARQSAIKKQQALPSIFGQSVSAGAASPSMLGDTPMFSGGMNVDRASTSGPLRIDVQKALAAGYSPKEIQDLDALRNTGMNEVARTIKGMQDGREVEQQFDKFGNVVGKGFEQYKAPITLDRGGQTDFVSPYIQPGQSFPKTMTFADRNAAANVGIAQQRLAMDKETQGKPQWIESLGGFVDPKQRVVRPAVDSQGNPIQTGAGGKSTEGERTAATLLQRMRSSEAQLEDALAGGKTGAEKPSIISNALRGMGAEMAANTWDSPARQKVESAQLDILDAALTLGTGAAYTREQLEGYRKSYFPQVGDDAAAVKDKQDRLNNILKAAEIKAGNAAKSVPSVQELKASRQGVAQNGWSIQKVD